jgi:hypothetical protein
MARQNKMRGQKRVSERQLSADERQHHRDGLSADAQLEVLDRRLGKGIGAVKERARLSKIEEETPTKEEDTTNE